LSPASTSAGLERPIDPVLRESGIARAEAMAYRDARGRAMTLEDWSAIEARLLRAYQLLKAAVQGT
jgi:hypothetical protein